MGGAFGEATITAFVLLHEGFGFAAEFVAFLFESVKGAAPFFGSVGGKFEAVDSEVGAFEEAFFVANGEDIDEDCLDMFAEF